MKTEHGRLKELSPEKVTQLLASSNFAHLGCIDQGEPYVVPITYAIDEKYLYSHSRMGKKVEIMRKSPRVCVQVEKVTDMFHWRSVVAWGQFEELEGDAAAKAMRLLILAIGRTQVVEVSDLEADFAAMAVDAVFFRIKLDLMTGREENR